MKRSEFLKLCGGFVMAVSFSPKVVAALKKINSEGPNLKLDIRPLTLKVGATKPFKALHLSDTHFYASRRARWGAQDSDLGCAPEDIPLGRALL